MKNILIFVFRSNLDRSKTATVEAVSMRHAMLVAADRLGVGSHQVTFVRILDSVQDDSAA